MKTDVGGVKTDVASTKADLEATKAKLQSTIGDLGVQSGLVANTREDLEILKHKGDRNYFEFTLIKGAKTQPVSTVGLQLKKTDVKKGKFTLNVTSDDRTIEKKDRNVSEPIQFYSGRDRMLYELVVWSVDKNKATGYLSTPKNAPHAGIGELRAAPTSKGMYPGGHVLIGIALRTAVDLWCRPAGRAAERQARSRADDALRSDSASAAQQCRAECDDRPGYVSPGRRHRRFDASCC